MTKEQELKDLEASLYDPMSRNSSAEILRAMARLLDGQRLDANKQGVLAKGADKRIRRIVDTLNTAADRIALIQHEEYLP